MLKFVRSVAACAAIGVCLGVVAPAHAEVIVPGVYDLHNHPQANPHPPGSGFRLDELYDAHPGQHDIFLFDFDSPQSLMTMTITATTIRVEGFALGGLVLTNQFEQNAYFGVYEINFLFDHVLLPAPGDDDMIVNPGPVRNLGTIRTPLGDTIQLVDQRDPEVGFSFRLGDEDTDSGHRGFDGISGWGWVNHGANPNQHVPFSDWIFTASVRIPTPGSVVLLLLGAIELFALRRRRPA